MKHLSSILVALAACGGPAATKPPTTGNPTTPPVADTHAVPAEPTTADQVLEASLVAQGGRAAMGKVTSMKITGTMEIAGLKGTMVTLTAPPRESLTTIDIAGLGTLLSGVHGDFAWDKNPMQGARVLSGPELVTTLRDATFNGDLVWKTLFPKAEYGGVVDFAGTKAYKVVLTSTDGETQTRYFAQDTKLPLGTEMITKSQMGKIPVSVALSDYRDVGGLKFPFKILNKSAGQAFTVTVTAYEPNAPVDPKVFEPPDDIKQLAAKKP